MIKMILRAVEAISLVCLVCGVSDRDDASKRA